MSPRLPPSLARSRAAQIARSSCPLATRRKGDLSPRRTPAEFRGRVHGRASRLAEEVVERGTEAGKGALTLPTLRLGVELRPHLPRCLREFATIDIARPPARPSVRPSVRVASRLPSDDGFFFLTSPPAPLPLSFCPKANLCAANLKFQAAPDSGPARLVEQFYGKGQDGAAHHRTG